MVIYQQAWRMALDDDSPQRKGGKARAKSLTPEARREIATRGARARWSAIEATDGTPVPKAIAMGILRIGSIPCAVLDDPDNTRVLTQAGLLSAIGRSPTPKSADTGVLAHLPAFVRAKNLEPYIPSDLICSSAPIIFETGGRGGTAGRALGYRAQVLPQVCWVYAKAQMAGKLVRGQRHIAEACTRLLEGLTDVAIDALVDEATGFQDIRARDALIRLLEKYVSKPALPWVQTFDDEFYREMFRLHGYAYDPQSVKRPMIFAKRTEDVYDRLAPGVREELQKAVRRGPSGRPSEKLFQHLTDHTGYKELRELLASVKTIMKLSKNTSDYQRKLDLIHPRFGDTMQLPFGDDEKYT